MMTSANYSFLVKTSLIFLTGVLFFSPVLATEQEFTLKIAQRQIAKKPPTIRVTRGDKLVLNWVTDEAVKLHLHGYDLLLTLTPGTTLQSPQKMALTAHIAGRFPLSAHGFGANMAAKHPHEIPLLYLEVAPR